MENEKKIEIPFGAFDSELIRQEISIPNGFKATIDGDKIILTRIESEDETIRKILIHFFSRPEITSLEYWEGISKKEVLAWLEKQVEVVSDKDDIEAEEKGIRKAFNKIWDEKQGEQKHEINNFDVLPGLYKCIHRMFDGTPDGGLLFEVGNVYKCLSKHDRAEFEVSYGHSVYLEDPVVCKHFIPLEKQGESYTKKDVDNAYIEGMAFAKDELDKQGDSPIKWNKNTKDCKPKVRHCVLMKTTHGIAEGEWQGEYWHQYRWAGLVRDADVLSWMELSDLEKQTYER